jgi:hypothetical protein
MPVYQELTSMHKMSFWKIMQKVQILNRSQNEKEIGDKKEANNNPLAFSSMLMSGLSTISNTSAQNSKAV